MANFVVTTLNDERAFTTNLATETSDGAGLSLREALELANANIDADIITFASSLTSGITPGVNNGRITLAQGPGFGYLTIFNDVTIDGDVNGDNVADIGRHRQHRVFAAAETGPRGMAP
jgi:hypothetical protein